MSSSPVKILNLVESPTELEPFCKEEPQDFLSLCTKRMEKNSERLAAVKINASFSFDFAIMHYFVLVYLKHTPKIRKVCGCKVTKVVKVHRVEIPCKAL